MMYNEKCCKTSLLLAVRVHAALATGTGNGVDESVFVDQRMGDRRCEYSAMFCNSERTGQGGCRTMIEKCNARWADDSYARFAERVANCFPQVR